MMMLILKQKLIHHSQIDLSNYYTKTEIDDLGNGLSTLILNTNNKRKTDILLTGYYNIGYLNTQFGLKANSLNTYAKSEVDNIINPLGVPSMLSTIKSNGTNILDIYYIPDIQKQKLILSYHLLIIKNRNW